jgi:CBS domain-containing protein
MFEPTVRDVMNTDLVVAPDESPLADIAALLTTHRISAVPIVDRFGVAIGVVSRTDIGEAIARDEQRSPTAGRWFRRRMRPRSRWRSRTATEVMTAPPATVGPDASLSAAGRIMHRRDVGRLLVVDHTDRLVGIVTRGDLLKIHNRLDAVVRDEVVQRVLRRTLLISPEDVQVGVDDGLVTLSGRVHRKSTTLAAVGLTEAVAGVTGVINQLAFDRDDITPVPAARRPGHDPFTSEAGGVGNVGHSFAAYAAEAVRSEAAR